MLWSINLRIMGKPNVATFGLNDIFTWISDAIVQNLTLQIVFFGVLLAVVLLLLWWMLHTEVGLALRGIGANAQLAPALGVNYLRYAVAGLGLANAITALAGALSAQLQGYGDVSMGFGLLVNGLASVILGEAIIGPPHHNHAAAGAGHRLPRVLSAHLACALAGPRALRPQACHRAVRARHDRLDLGRARPHPRARDLSVSMSTTQVPGYCTLCRSRCGTLNTIEDGRLIRVEALPGHPTGNAICSKGRAAPEIAHDPKRLTHPLRRTKPKSAADPGWEPISWDQALDEIANKLMALRARHGAETVAFALSSPSGTALTDSYDWLERLAWLYGSPNVLNGTEVCNWPKDFAHRFTFGHGIPPPDYARSDLIVLWGFNPASSWMAHAWAISQAVMRGAKLIVVDPRRSGFAATAHQWLAIKPGTDGILALGLARLLIEQHRYDEEFVRCWTTAPLLVRDDTGVYLRWSDLIPGEPADYVAWDEGEGRPVRYDTTRAIAFAQARRFALSTTVNLTIAGRAVRCSPAFALYAQACAPYTLERVAARHRHCAGCDHQRGGFDRKLGRAELSLLDRHLPACQCHADREGYCAPLRADRPL